ncbi:GTPase Era, mitochondrial [Calliopsis andreniformis]|uniref:GTPase Era, mitochondrial n=1 Tax=Calliopsis andreniformis TaxID=337506 RepID=UPI003FCC98D0
MLFTLRKCALQFESYFCKRLIFYSTTLNTESKNVQYEPSIQRIEEEHILRAEDNLILRKEGRKSLKVAILGLPNAGKSTLVNQLIHRTVCPTSSKVHTTTHKAEAIYSENDTQIVFMDTPGLTTNHEMKKYKLAESFRKDLETSIAQADVVGILQDVTNVYTRHMIHNFIIDYLKNKKEDTSVILILNKVDKLKKKFVLLELTRLLTSNKDFPTFADVFMVSALNGDGIDDLRNYLLDSAKENDWHYEQTDFIDQPIKKIIEETVRASALDFLPQDVPYCIQIELEHLDVGQDGSIKTVVNMKCNKPRFLKFLLGNKGKALKAVSQSAEQRLQNAFRTRVVVLLSVIKI